MENNGLINEASSIIVARKLGDRLIGDVGCALLTDKGNVYTGVSIDTPSTGICAEHAAIAAMITASERRISKIVATWKDENGNAFVIAPCGKCRELIYQMSGDLETKVILSPEKEVKLSELLPYRSSWEKVNQQ